MTRPDTATSVAGDVPRARLPYRWVERWDRVSTVCGWAASCMALLACLISAGNAVLRYFFSLGSNAWLEMQWYLFFGIVLLGASVTLKTNEHVRVDLFYGMLSPRRKAWVDLFGLVVFLLPSMTLLAVLSWPFFVTSFELQETSSNAGGLARWPVKLLMPVGFVLVAVQGLAEIAKRIGFLRGEYRLDTHYEKPLQ